MERGTALGRPMRADGSEWRLIWICKVVISESSAPGGTMDHRTGQPARNWGLVALCAVLGTLLGGSLAAPSRAQEAPPGPPPPPPTDSLKIQKGQPIRIETQITLVGASVTDPLGRLVTGLEQQHFRVFEDGVEQEIIRFSSEDVPVSIGVIFDMSGSMADKIDNSRQAAVPFFRTENP